MKIIYKIAKAELQSLFFSPIAWLILILYTFQTGMDFAGLVDGVMKGREMGYGVTNGTSRFFGGWDGVLTVVQGYLYLYIPLLTMNLMSRELGSGSIKLLYSSPVTNVQIILGKYLSMLIYALVLVGILVLYVIIGAIIIKNFDYPQVLTGLLGIYFLICAYAAIGLLMSSLTSYQVVAAVGTLAVLSLLTYVQGWWQDIEFVRDLTYWLAMPGRSREFLSGMVCSANVIYFFLVIALFLAMAIIRLQSRRQKSKWTVTWGKYLGVWAIVLLLGYVTSRPAFKSYYDATATKLNTLTPNSQKIIGQMDGKLKMTTYVNLLDKYFWVGLPARVNEDLKLFEQYVRFKPDMEMEYVYYYDTPSVPAYQEEGNLTMEEQAKKMMKINDLNPKMFLTPEQIKAKIDLSGEHNRLVRELEYNGKKTFLRIFDDNMIFPTEAEISAALKRLVMDLPKVGFLQGHGERAVDNVGERAYSMFTHANNFRYALINQGFDFAEVTLEKGIPEDINILVVAEMKEALNEQEQQYFDEYIARGGNLVVIGEPKRQEVMNPLIASLGVRFMPGCIVCPTVEYDADLVLTRPTEGAQKLSYWFHQLGINGYGIMMPNAVGLEYTEDKGFEVTPLLMSPESGSWNELETVDFVDGKAELNAEAGEVEKSYPTALALSRKKGDREQKILIIGDADCVSNGELLKTRPGVSAFNYYLIAGGFHWLSDGEVPIDIRRPQAPDNEVFLNERSASILSAMFVWILPCFLLLLALFIWLRRRGR